MKTLQIVTIVFLIGLSFSCKAETKNEINSIEIAHNSSPVVEKHYIKVALLLDTSNSMDGLIDQAKAQLWEIVNELSYAKCRNERPNLQIALYEYGNDNLNSRNGYIRKILGFTEDLDDVSKELFSLTTNGGSEYCGTVIHSSIKQLDWGNDADDLKMIFIAGNEPFTQGKINYKDAALEAREKDIVVNTIFCGDYKHGISSKWQHGAQLAYGDYMAINHNRHTVHIASPFDDLILQLNIKLNGTYIPYGSHGRMKIAMQEEQDANAAGYNKANAVSRTVTKGSHLYKNSSWDLVDAEKEQGFSYDKLKNEDLPENLQGKSKAEIKAFVAKQRKEREAIQQEIANLNEKRRKFIAEKKSDTDNGLESAMIQALKKQAEKKDYNWD
ncbi:MAG: VWA domain-containing protein [Bacteroidia bacterium]|nr:VWA domain-containing protein [Bacteroidia bacterium]NNF32302.1 VWA domain-containing protein [Flavobacteriaceae bacterium]MBT8276102.1 VWA domain-containing protein [Bacteroidia bacterium]NNJ83006.1 VWA domain-containing protein [Flavobacteriaceae bacterium]NNK53928.1 VWA domain-containing protein [Flavobacteriaceae bacterium]